MLKIQPLEVLVGTLKSRKAHLPFLCLALVRFLSSQDSPSAKACLKK